MAMLLKEKIRPFVPPILVEFLRRSSRNSFSGDYASWSEARLHSTGYDSDVILKKVKNALLRVKNGSAVYERDSVLFDQIQYSWPVLAGLLRVAALRENRLEVTDFGGSLGSSYFQCRGFLSSLNELRWHVVEQENFVRCGKEEFESEELRFHFTLQSCLQTAKPDVLLISGTLQCIEDPYGLLEEVNASGIEHIIIDRTPFIPGPRDRLTVQRVPHKIYDASCPVWFLSIERFLASISRCYRVLAEFPALDGTVRIGRNLYARYQGFIVDRYDNSKA